MTNARQTKGLLSYQPLKIEFKVADSKIPLPSKYDFQSMQHRRDYIKNS